MATKLVGSRQPLDRRKSLGLILAMVGVGIAATLVARAAGQFKSVEAESGQLAGAAKTQAVAGASGGQAIKFGGTPTPTPGAVHLDDPHKKDIAMQLVSSAENSTLNWRAQYSYIEDIGDGRGYTAGIIGFCSGCGDMTELVKYYNSVKPNNILTKYTSALTTLGNNESSSHSGLDPTFVGDWRTAASDAVFKAAQDHERDRVYFNPAVSQGKTDGLRALGQFIYYDALVMHGPGSDSVSFGGIRATALRNAATPAQGGNEATYLNAFLNARKAAMLTEEAHSDTSRVDTAQRVFLNAGNFHLNPPLSWQVYGDSYFISQ